MNSNVLKIRLVVFFFFGGGGGDNLTVGLWASILAHPELNF